MIEVPELVPDFEPEQDVQLLGALLTVPSQIIELICRRRYARRAAVPESKAGLCTGPSSTRGQQDQQRIAESEPQHDNPPWRDVSFIIQAGSITKAP